MGTCISQGGAVFGLEMSRRARSSKDWHQLLQVCAVFHTLLADQDGLYDPTDYNGRLLLGIKGTLSEAELHILNGRLAEGRLNKARRGELFNHAPIGYARMPGREVAMDHDEQVLGVLRLVFGQLTASAACTACSATWSSTRSRCRCGPNRGQLE